VGWLSLITGLIKLANLIAGYASDRQLISAGEAKAVSEGLDATLKTIDLANRAKAAMAGDGDFANGVRDKYQRPPK
jgi:hypothetical protein